MSVLLKVGFGLQPASAATSSAALNRKIMVNQQRREQCGEIDDGIAEGLLCQAVAVGEIDSKRIGDEDSSQRDGANEVDDAAHADHIRQQADAEQDECVEQ